MKTETYLTITRIATPRTSNARKQSIACVAMPQG